MHCQDEFPEDRTDFQHPDLRTYVTNNRLDLLRDALTILRAWFVAGRPDMKLTPWGSFECWSEIIRNTICWIGLPDPGETREELRSQADTDTTALMSLIEAMSDIDPEQDGRTASQLSSLVEQVRRDENMCGNEDGAIRQLSDALLELCSTRTGSPSAHTVGNALRRVRGRVCSGQAVDYREKGGRTRLWIVKKVR
jgi:hypothetical protein